jgi:hypothetical protein
MAATPYLVMVPTQDSMPARTLVNGVEGMVVVAGSTADAKAICKAQFSQDVNALWDNATVTALVADTNLHGWSLDILINNVDGTVKGHVTVVADGTVDGSVAASQVLTSSANYSDGETVTIGTRVYTLQGTLTAGDGHVHIGASEAATIGNLHHAINNSGGTPGTDYNVTAADPLVTATDNGVHALTVTAKTAGTAGNSIATTETSATASWGATTLAGGEDADTFDTMANAAVTALNAGGFGVTHASYNASTNVLTVAGTADNLGDHSLVVSMFSADRVRDVPIPDALGTITDGGSSGAALTVALAADDWPIPIAAAGVRLVEWPLS